MSIIDVTNLSKTYVTYKRGEGLRETVKSMFHRERVDVHAVDNVSFSIEAGEICGILGPNGAGKSTTIKMLCGALYPTSGTISVMGYEPFRDRRKYVGQIGAVFGQKSQLIWDIPPIDSFAMNKAIYGIPDPAYRETLDDLVERLGVADVIRKPTRVLSLGERMKCEFIMSMLHRPTVVFLDEPTIGLDVIAKATIRDFIQSMHAQGTTFLLTTHDLEDVERLAERVIIIGGGHKVFDGTLHDLRHSLGEKKIIELTLARPLTSTEIADLPIVSHQSELEVTLEVDTAVTTASDLLKALSARLEITDISIKELPMDQIITAIYTDADRE